MEWTEGDLVWFDPNIGHPLPGEIQEVHRAAQVIIVQAVINGKVSKLFYFDFMFNFFLLNSICCFLFGSNFILCCLLFFFLAKLIIIFVMKVADRLKSIDDKMTNF